MAPSPKADPLAVNIALPVVAMLIAEVAFNVLTVVVPAML